MRKSTCLVIYPKNVVHSRSHSHLLIIITWWRKLSTRSTPATNNWQTWSQEHTNDLPQITDKLDHIMLLLNAPSHTQELKSKTLVVIDTDSTDSYKYNYHKITAMMTHRTLILLICQSSLKIKIAWIINQQCFINKCIFLLILWIFSSSCNKDEIIRWYFTLFFRNNHSTVPLLDWCQSVLLNSLSYLFTSISFLTNSSHQCIGKTVMWNYCKISYILLKCRHNTSISTYV